MEKSRAIELLKLAVPIKALTQQEYADFVEAVNMGMDALKQPEKAQLSREGTTSEQPEPTRVIPETRAIPSDDDRVSLSEKVTATYYDEEYEEWSQKTVTVRDVLDAVCDEYTVLPSAQPEPKEGHWINGKCDLCGEHAPFWCMASIYHESNYCPRCGARMKGCAG